MLIISYVTGNDSAIIAYLLQQMHKAFSMKELGSLSYFLGISVHSDEHGYFLSRAKYAAALLHKAGLQDCKPCSFPMVVKTVCSAADSLPFAQPFLYRSLVGGLQYLTITRPDLSYAINQVCPFMHLPTNAHFQVVKRLLRYVKGTLSHGLSFIPSPFDLSAFSDSNWGSDSLDRKSTFSYCVYLGSNLISWSAKKQATIYRSSTEAEYRALAHTIAELTWIQQLLKDFRVSSSTIPAICYRFIFHDFVWLWVVI
ncbi:uncharacterized protein LOC114284336 [Camellia sinensis]|uniref:uncharacterized protein LOC114284336 n=1 Tax=Camellia sinensis TaxID=4442 RepID=UPI001036AEAF|nr:uncharacterized protein LOC114284336 [Camellia sinensis]